MTYKGYVGDVRMDKDLGLFRGKIVNIEDTIIFQCRTIEEATQAFYKAIDTYLDLCKAMGKDPEKPGIMLCGLL